MREAIRLAGPGRPNLVLNNLVNRGTRADLAIDPGAATVAGNVVTESPA
jgi:hypothetical protein